MPGTGWCLCHGSSSSLQQRLQLFRGRVHTVLGGFCARDDITQVAAHDLHELGLLGHCRESFAGGDHLLGLWHPWVLRQELVVLVRCFLRWYTTGERPPHGDLGRLNPPDVLPTRIRI